MNIVGIQFDDNDRIKYYFVDNLELNKNVTVIVQNEDSLHFGKVMTSVRPIDKLKLTKNLGQVIRIASKKDYKQHMNNINDAKQALSKCKQLVKRYNLEMNVIDAIYTFDKDQLIFHFYSENRVDFRSLAKDLASIYKTRIELRQIGVRDKAKKVCGIGPCGQKLCCSRFLEEFDSVSISMAKNQNLSLNPNKINGVCGRLLCCLKYENDCYKQCKKNMPSIGQVVEVQEGTGKVVSIDILNSTYKIETDKGIIEVKKSGCC